MNKQDATDWKVGATEELEAKAATGDRDAIRELRLLRLANVAQSRIHGELRPDANGRVKGDPMYTGEERQ